jgi:hypothetical protein
MNPQQTKGPEDLSWAYLTFALLVGFPLCLWIDSLSTAMKLLILIFLFATCFIVGLFWFSYFSKYAKDKQKRREIYEEIPEILRSPQKGSVVLGKDCDLTVPIYFPDSIRSRHVHILGSTGSGKTESVILNLLKQDIALGRGAIILDAKGDDSFQKHLKKWLPEDRLSILDLSNCNSQSFDPIRFGTPHEAALRLHASLTWSESYYGSKALTALLRIFENHFKRHNENPTIHELSRKLYNAATFSGEISADSKERKELEEMFNELAGLCDQVKTLSLGNLQNLLSPKKTQPQIDLKDALSGKVIYFRLQSLVSPQTVASVGKLILNNINYLAGQSHRTEREHGSEDQRDLLPIFLDEFAAFASAEFAPLIAMARSAKFALHFSHQSIGDLVNVDRGFVSQITDNSGTKIVMRINDPDTADYFAKSFGTKLINKITQRITKTDVNENGELVGEGSSREAHQFRANPDLLKTLPTGMAAVLMAHGEETKEGASHVFKIKFPRLDE